MNALDGTMIGWAPLVPWWVLIVIGALALLITATALWRRARGTAWRALALAGLWVALANPALIQERRQYQKDVGVVVVDDSASQGIGDRRKQTEAALAKLVEAAKSMPDFELRVVRTGTEAEAATGNQGTLLFKALERASADIPRKRFAGAVFITDGQVHDVPTAEAQGGLPGPIHALITGKQGEVDRRLVIVRAPTYGLVDKPVTVTIRVEDTSSAKPEPVPLAISRDGVADGERAVLTNQDVDIEIPIQHGGQTIVELSAALGPNELTPVNNRAVVAINGIRDRLRVLLISGEPHPGERTWRNLLKADPSVDLVHFTILRPPEKQDGTPINELSLIAFPIRELFEIKLNDFDLIIFDRYRRRNIVPRAYLQAVANYVENGGAVLEVAGPAYSTNLGLYNSPLGEVLPGEPTGKVFEQPYKAAITDLGRRHPVTTGLAPAGDASKDPGWGRWYRQIEMRPKRGQVVMSGVDNQPLLILDRIGKGRIAQLASDHIWLWSRGFDGGGPQAELLRRLAHWLMKEPQLEEEDLTAALAGSELQITRHSLTPGDVPVTVTDPLGETRQVTLKEQGNSARDGGRATASIPVSRPGLYRIEDGQRTALAAVGAINPKEFADVRATEALLSPVANATGGGTFWIGTGSGPEARRVREDRGAKGRDWLGFIAHRDYEVTGVDQVPLLPGVLVLLLGLGALMLAWQREGR